MRDQYLMHATHAEQRMYESDTSQDYSLIIWDTHMYKSVSLNIFTDYLQILSLFPILFTRYEYHYLPILKKINGKARLKYQGKWSEYSLQYETQKP